MADTMQFDLVSPEKRLASLAAREVRIPGADGDMTAMPDHAPVITTLRPGILTVVGADGASQSFAVTGGFAEIGTGGASVLAEKAMPAGDVSASVIEALIADAQAQAAEAPAEAKDAAEKVVADMQALRGALGV
ncbi:MAG: F0F1 ATP synthase subunit epsilon [Rhodobacteraceae bacterium]|nr:F0F1 ATP synthase subunit epsilon [Paracoccaceae bacterium]